MIKSNVIGEDDYFEFNVKKLAKKILYQTTHYLKLKSRHVVSYIFVDIEEIYQINKKYRRIDKPTDVISFAYKDSEDEIDLPYELGDIFICKEKVVEQAKELGHSNLRECAFLMTHGILHLLGYNHLEKEDEDLMISLQNGILNKLKIIR